MSCVQVAPPVHINNNVVVTPPSGYHVPLKFYYIIYLNLHSHDLRVPVGSLSRLKLSLPQCNVPGVLNCTSGRLSGFPSLY